MLHQSCHRVDVPVSNSAGWSITKIKYESRLKPCVELKLNLEKRSSLVVDKKKKKKKKVARPWALLPWPATAKPISCKGFVFIRIVQGNSSLFFTVSFSSQLKIKQGWRRSWAQANLIRRYKFGNTLLSSIQFVLVLKWSIFCNGFDMALTWQRNNNQKCIFRITANFRQLFCNPAYEPIFSLDSNPRFCGSSRRCVFFFFFSSILVLVFWGTFWHQ